MSWGQDMPCDIGDPMQFYLFRLLVRCRASPCGRRFVLPSGSFFPLYFSLLRCAPCHSECGPLRADGSLQRRVLCGLILSLSHFGLPAQTSLLSFSSLSCCFLLHFILVGGVILPASSVLLSVALLLACTHTSLSLYILHRLPTGVRSP